METKTISLRIDKELYDAIVHLSEKERRTFNLQVQALVEKGIDVYEQEQEYLKSRPTHGANAQKRDA